MNHFARTLWSVLYFSLVLSLFVSPFIRSVKAEEVSISITKDFSGDWVTNWNASVWNGHDNARVKEDLKNGKGKFLRVYYDQGVVGSNGGYQFVAPIPTELNNRDELYLGYYIRTVYGFEWVKGGKLPGLMSGHPKNTTGGVTLDGTQGFSARYMWDSGNRVGPYVYVPNQFAMPQISGKYGWKSPINEFKIPEGQWVYLVQRIKLNTPGLYNGEFQIWINDVKYIDVKNVLYRTTDFKIDGFYFSTFYGGGDLSWAPTKSTNYIDFAKFTFSNQYPVMQ